MAAPNNFRELITTLNWSAIAASAQNQAPTVDTVIEIKNASEMAIQIDSTAGANVSTDIDINVHTTVDGTNFDTVPYTTYPSLGDAAIATFLVSAGVKQVKLRLDNNDDANAATVTARVYQRA